MSLCSVTFSRSFQHLRLTSCNALLPYRDTTSSFSTGHGSLAAAPTVPKTMAKAKASKPKQDKPKTKRPPTAYNLFMKDALLGVKDSKDQPSYKESFTKAAHQYKVMKAGQKQKYLDEAAQLRDEYQGKLRIEKGPKRPATVYNLYVRDQFPNRPKDQKASEYMKVLGQSFRDLNAAERKKYEDIFAKDKVRYLEEKALEPEKPKVYKKPPSGYTLFLADYAKNNRDAGQGMLLQAAVEWKNLDDQRKQKYQDLAAGAKTEFLKQHGDPVKKGDAVKKSDAVKK